MTARAGLYRRGWLASERAPVPVISIGNIVAGGTGKTPVTALVAVTLRDAGIACAIVSRGYRGRREEDPLVVSDGAAIRPGATAAAVGDEPVMLARRLSGVSVVVSRRRVEGARLAATTLGARCVVLDDGFQHLALKRDLDIVLLDASHPLDNGRLLPAGMLREPPSALARAQALVLTGPRSSDSAAMTSAAGRTPATIADMNAVSRWAAPRVPIFDIALEPTHVVGPGLRDAPGPMESEAQTADGLAGKRVIAFAGIARPVRLSEDLRRLGAEVVAFFGYGDHHEFRREEIAEILERARALGPDAVVTTEKDLARLHGTEMLAPLAAAGLVALRVEAMPSGSQAGAFRDLILGAAQGAAIPSRVAP